MGGTESHSTTDARTSPQSVIQEYDLEADEHHDILSYKYRMPKPPPPREISAVETWPTDKLCKFIRSHLEQSYGDRFLHIDEVVSNFKTQLINGAEVPHLQPKDWKKLCPYIGPRTEIVESLKAYNHPIQEDVSKKITTEKAGPPTSAKPEKEQIDAVETRVEVRIPSSYVVPWARLFFQRSMFSNHRLVDCPWQPDSKRSFVVQLWQIFVYEVVRITFFTYICRQYGMKLRHVPYFVIPVASTGFCYHFKLFAFFPPPYFTVIVVLPLSFALNAAYQRREQALQILALVKTSSKALHCFSVIWSATQTDLPSGFDAIVERTLGNTFHNFGSYLTASSEVDRNFLLSNIYLQYKDIFFQTDMYRLAGIAPPLVGVPFNTAVSLIVGFERMRQFCDYRTPCTIRSFNSACVILLAIFMGPWFAYICSTFEIGTGFLLCVVFIWMLNSVCKIQSILEMPYARADGSNAEDSINLVPLLSSQTLRGKAAAPPARL